MSEATSSQVHTFSPPYTELSAAAKIPPELCDNILFFVGEELQYYITGKSDIYRRRYHENMQVLHACSLTCTWWEKLTRPRMFRRLVLRSPDDIRMLKRFLRSPPSPRISSIGAHIESLAVYFTLDRYPWFYDIPSLRSNGANKLRNVSLYIRGPMPVLSETNLIRHPLFYHAPRTLPISFPPEITIDVVDIEGVYLPSELTALNLLHDFNGLRRNVKGRHCGNITWNISGTRDAGPAPSTIYGGMGQEVDAIVGECTNRLLILSHLLDSRRTWLQNREVQAACLDVPDTLRVIEIIRTIENFDYEGQDGKQSSGFQLVGPWYLTIGFCAEGLEGSDLPENLSSKYTYFLSTESDVASLTYFSEILPTENDDTILQVKCVLIDFTELQADDLPNLPKNTWALDPSNPHWNMWKKIIGLIYGFPTLECLAVMANDEDQLSRYVAWFSEELAPFRDNERVGLAWYCFDINWSANRPYKIEIGYEDLLKRAKEIEELEDGGSSDESGSEMSNETEASFESSDFDVKLSSQSKSNGKPEVQISRDVSNSTDISGYHRATQFQVDYSIAAPKDNDPRCNTCADYLIAVCRQEDGALTTTCPTCSGYPNTGCRHCRDPSCVHISR